MDEIEAKIAACVSEVLAVEPERVGAETRLMSELGADSLDLVELMYRVEEAFDVELGQEDMSLTAQLGLPEAQLHTNEVLTERALGLLRARFPWAGDILVEGATRWNLAELMTVAEVARTIRRKLSDDPGPP